MHEFWILYLECDEACRAKGRDAGIQKTSKGIDLLGFLYTKFDLEREILSPIETWNATVRDFGPSLFEQVTSRMALKKTKAALNEQRMPETRSSRSSGGSGDEKRTTL